MVINNQAMVWSVEKNANKKVVRIKKKKKKKKKKQRKALIITVQIYKFKYSNKFP